MQHALRSLVDERMGVCWSRSALILRRRGDKSLTDRDVDHLMSCQQCYERPCGSYYLLPTTRVSFCSRSREIQDSLWMKNGMLVRAVVYASVS